MHTVYAFLSDHSFMAGSARYCSGTGFRTSNPRSVVVHRSKLHVGISVLYADLDGSHRCSCEDQQLCRTRTELGRMGNVGRLRGWHRHRWTHWCAARSSLGLVVAQKTPTDPGRLVDTSVSRPTAQNVRGPPRWKRWNRQSGDFTHSHRTTTTTLILTFLLGAVPVISPEREHCTICGAVLLTAPPLPTLTGLQLSARRTAL